MKKIDDEQVNAQTFVEVADHASQDLYSDIIKVGVRWNAFLYDARMNIPVWARRGFESEADATKAVETEWKRRELDHEMV